MLEQQKFHIRHWLLPKIFLVEIDIGFRQQILELIIKRLLLMMFLLVSNIISKAGNL